MYQPYTPAESLRAVHEMMIAEELQRRDPRHHLRFRSGRRRGPMIAMRRVVGRVLIAIGTRLDPAAGGLAPTSVRLSA